MVNHLMGDGSARGVKDNVDPTLYMHVITRAGMEPVNESFQKQEKPSLIKRLLGYR
ncbi:MAG: hypothetical protein JW888_11320 [Pirellulales bacterium]|nr:hypothetical protein [Pirellulales bacterium]